MNSGPARASAKRNTRRCRRVDRLSPTGWLDPPRVCRATETAKSILAVQEGVDVGCLPTRSRSARACQAELFNVRRWGL